MKAETYRYNAAFAYCQARDLDKATVQDLRPLLTSRKNGAKRANCLANC